jgi:hypothetical protein
MRGLILLYSRSVARKKSSVKVFVAAITALVVIAAVGIAMHGLDPVSRPVALPTTSGATPGSTDALLRQLFESQANDVPVSGTGKVRNLLADDNDGARHQRFILELASGQTLLIAHNIDIAPRLSGLSVGDTVSFSGEYIYNDQGGTIHWTHHDPDGSHVSGWLDWNGKRYS